jgi:hypothetical protein
MTPRALACSVIDTACKIWHSMHNRRMIWTALAAIFAFKNRSYLSEFEAEFNKALARESGAQRVLFDEKTEGRKSHDTTGIPLKGRSRYRYTGKVEKKMIL